MLLSGTIRIASDYFGDRSIRARRRWQELTCPPFHQGEKTNSYILQIQGRGTTISDPFHHDSPIVRRCRHFKKILFIIIFFFTRMCKKMRMWTYSLVLFLSSLAEACYNRLQCTGLPFLLTTDIEPFTIYMLWLRKLPMLQASTVSVQLSP
jgi:hypothetical protein